VWGSFAYARRNAALCTYEKRCSAMARSSIYGKNLELKNLWGETLQNYLWTSKVSILKCTLQTIPQGVSTIDFTVPDYG